MGDWGDLTREPDGNWHLFVIRESKATDTYEIPDRDTPALAALLGVEVQASADDQVLAKQDESILAAWRHCGGRALEMLQEAGVTATKKGVWIAYGDFGESFTVDEDGTSTRGWRPPLDVNGSTTARSISDRLVQPRIRHGNRGEPSGATTRVLTWRRPVLGIT